MGQGYATEAALFTLKYGFQNINLDWVEGRVHVENIASQKVLEKIGMTYQTEDFIDGCPVKIYKISSKIFYDFVKKGNNMRNTS